MQGEFISTYATNMALYSRNKALWFLLLAAPIAARFMISENAGEGIVLAVGKQVPVLTSLVMGVWLGIVVSTFVMPVAYIYLRSNTTRRQPWQVEEVTAASRLAIALGRFGADATVICLLLAALSLAGCFLGWLMVSGPWNPLHIVLPLWIIAAPTLLVVAGLRTLFDAVPAFRSALGDVLFFLIWMPSPAIAIMLVTRPSSYAVNMADLLGFARPLVAGAPAGTDSFVIGVSQVLPGRVELDVMQGLTADGYLAARATWALLAVMVAVVAGLIYRPHRLKLRKQRFGWLRHVSLAKLMPTVKADPATAPAARAPGMRSVLAELRLIASGRMFPILAIAASLVGLAGDYRHLGSPAALLLLGFALSAHAGRSEAKGLVHLTGTMMVSSGARRVAFIVAGLGWSLVIAVPAALVEVSAYPLKLAATTGLAASATAIALAWATRSPFAARTILIIGWYAYFSA